MAIRSDRMFSLVLVLSPKANDYLIRRMNKNAVIGVIKDLVFVAFAGLRVPN